MVTVYSVTLILGVSAVVDRVRRLARTSVAADLQAYIRLSSCKTSTSPTRYSIAPRGDRADVVVACGGGALCVGAQ